MLNALDDIITRLSALSPDELEAFRGPINAATKKLRWAPNFGPQMQAYDCLADELFYGGEAGGGKTDLLLGTALNLHRRSLILRRLNGEVMGLVDRMEEILGTRKGFSGHPSAIWRLKNQIIMFGGCQYLDDRKKYQGTPKDFIGFDEVTNFLEDQYTFITAWARSTVPGQRVRVICTGNPPTDPEGLWVIKRWAAWLDKKHPNPALPGELRWYTTIDGNDVECEGPGPVTLPDGSIHVGKDGKPILPKSRTFIPAELGDNPDLAETGYAATLAALPPALRSSMYEGDFSAQMQDDIWQVIPTEWVEQAQNRWSPEGHRHPMDALGVDIAQGGADNTTIIPRHGSWFGMPKVYPGRDTPDGPTVAGLVFMEMRNGCEVILDMSGGWGGSTMDHLKQQFSPTPFNGGAGADALRDRTGALKFANLRAAAYWHLREALDPNYGSHIALPPDPLLAADLCAPRYKVTTRGVLLEPKEDVKKRIGRSPDRGDACVMAHFAKGKRNFQRLDQGKLQAKAITSGRNPRRR